MAQLQIGKKAPQFTLAASNGEKVKLSDYLGHPIVLFFYPKDLTATCTQQACDFRDAFAEYRELDAVVLGISADDVKSHVKFVQKKELPFLLLADTDKKVCEKYGVWQLKKLYGKEYMGIVRSTFLIDKKGKLVREWRKVKAKGHVQQVLEAVQELEGGK